MNLTVPVPARRSPWDADVQPDIPERDAPGKEADHAL